MPRSSQDFIQCFMSFTGKRSFFCCAVNTASVHAQCCLTCISPHAAPLCMQHLVYLYICNLWCLGACSTWRSCCVLDMVLPCACSTWCCSMQAAQVSCCTSGDQALRELPSPGKSGSVFFLSHDDRFIIKTMRKVSRPALMVCWEFNVPQHTAVPSQQTMSCLMLVMCT